MSIKTRIDLSRLEWEIEPDKFSCLKRNAFSLYSCYTVVGILRHHVELIIQSSDHILLIGKDRSWMLNSVEDLNDFMNNKTYLE